MAFENEFYKVLAVKAAKRHADEIAQEIHNEESSRWADFLVLCETPSLFKDSDRKRIVVLHVGLELDGREAEIEIANETENFPNEQEWLANVLCESAELYDGIYESQAYANAIARYNGVEPEVRNGIPDHVEGILVSEVVESFWETQGEKAINRKVDIRLTKDWDFEARVFGEDGNPASGDGAEPVILFKHGEDGWKSETGYGQYIGTKIYYSSAALHPFQ